MRKILLLFLIFAGFMACDKDGDFFIDEESVIIQQSDYALQAEELLNQLTLEQQELLTPEDIADFKKGPEADIAMRNQGNNYGSWHPVLAIFDCEVNEGMTVGDGYWFGHGHSTLEIDVTPSPNSGFDDGNFILTNPDQAKLMGPYRAKRMHHFGYQRLKGKFETGSQIFFYPKGNVRMLTFFNSNGNQPLQIFVIGWAKYGLADPPVPMTFEEYFSFDALYEHYVGLQEIPGAEAMYVSTENIFWLYPTIEGKTAAPGISKEEKGDWLGHGPITFVVDQTLVDVEGKGRWRLYDGPRDDYQTLEYMDFCHDHYLGDTGGTWPFDLVGGSAAFSNFGGKGTGVWIGGGDPNEIFGNIPEPGLLPPDMIDDGFTCETYGSNECYPFAPGICNVGDGVTTYVYIIAYLYPL